MLLLGGGSAESSIVLLRKTTNRSRHRRPMSQVRAKVTFVRWSVGTKAPWYLP